MGERLVHLPALMSEAWNISRSEARRLIHVGAVRTGSGDLISDPDHKADGSELRVGRRRRLRLPDA